MKRDKLSLLRMAMCLIYALLKLLSTSSMHAQDSINLGSENQQLNLTTSELISSKIQHRIARKVSQCNELIEYLRNIGLSLRDVRYDLCSREAKHQDNQLRGLESQIELYFYRNDENVPWYMNPLESVVCRYYVNKDSLSFSVHDVSSNVTRTNRELETRECVRELIMTTGDRFTIEEDQSNNVSISFGTMHISLNYDRDRGVTIHSISIGDGPLQKHIVSSLRLDDITVYYSDTSRFWSRTVRDIDDYGHRIVAIPRDINAFRLYDGTIDTQRRVLGERVLVRVRKNVVQKRSHQFRWPLPSRVVSKELDIMYTYVYGNYNYVVCYSLTENGVLSGQVELAGHVLSQYRSTGEKSRMTGNMVAPDWWAPSHEHVFSFSFEPSIATKQSVYEVDLVRRPKGIEMEFPKVH